MTQPSPPVDPTGQLPTPPTGFPRQLPAAPPAYPAQPGFPAPKRKTAGTAVAAGVLALLMALVFGGYGMLAWFIGVFDRDIKQAWYFAIVAIAGVLALVGAIMLFAEKRRGGVLLLVSSGLFVLGSLVLAFAPIPEWLGRGETDDPRMKIHLVGIPFALIIALLVVLPSTRRYLSREPQQVGQPLGQPMQPQAPLPPNPVGKGLAIAAAVCGLLLGLIMISIAADVGLQNLLDLNVLPQVLGVIIAVIGAVVVLIGRTWSGGLLLVIGGAIALAYILVALFRSDGESDFRGVVFLLASIGAVALPLLPWTRNHLRAGAS